MVKARLITISDLGSRVRLGWRHWAELAAGQFPCAYVNVSSEGPGPDYVFASGRVLEGGFWFDVWGYTQPAGPFATPDDVAEAQAVSREALLKQVFETLTAEQTDVDLLADNQANASGFGVTHIAPLRAPATDANSTELIVGYGLFRLPCAGRLHTRLTSY